MAQMSDHHREILRTKRVDIMRSMVLTPQLLSCLIADGALTTEMQELILNTKTTSSGKIGDLLDLLARRPDCYFTSFLNALIETNQHETAVLIDPIYRRNVNVSNNAAPRYTCVAGALTDAEVAAGLATIKYSYDYVIPDMMNVEPIQDSEKSKRTASAVWISSVKYGEKTIIRPKCSEKELYICCMHMMKIEMEQMKEAICKSDDDINFVLHKYRGEVESVTRMFDCLYNKACNCVMKITISSTLTYDFRRFIEMMYGLAESKRAIRVTQGDDLVFHLKITDEFKNSLTDPGKSFVKVLLYLATLPSNTIDFMATKLAKPKSDSTVNSIPCLYSMCRPQEKGALLKLLTQYIPQKLYMDILANLDADAEQLPPAQKPKGKWAVTWY